jgi:hypothetical protein
MSSSPISPAGPVLRLHTDVTPAFLTEALRTRGWIRDAEVLAAPSETIGAGLMGVCARYTLEYDREEEGAPASIVGKFAAIDETARTFMSSTGYRNEVCFYEHFADRLTIAPRCAHVAIDDEGWFTLLLEDAAPLEPGDQLVGCTIEQVETAVAALVGLHATFWDAPEVTGHACFGSGPSIDPELVALGVAGAVPGFLERYAHAFAPDEIDFFHRLAEHSANWYAARPAPRALIHADYRPDNLLFSPPGAAAAVKAVDWQGFMPGNPAGDVAFLVGNALTVDDRRANEARLLREYHDALVAAGVEGYSFEQCEDDYSCSFIQALSTTIFGAMYGARTTRGDRMFELMGGRHARQILDLGADRFLG